tara:strand:+ start:13895 stop:14203 length:309 start_codon:yes stop_codon:yes gene_type:complete
MKGVKNLIRKRKILSNITITTRIKKRMKQSKTEGNLASFKIFVNSKGTVMTEFSIVPSHEANKVFKDNELLLIKKLLTEAEIKLGGLHEYFENELSSFVQPT